MRIWIRLLATTIVGLGLVLTGGCGKKGGDSNGSSSAKSQASQCNKLADKMMELLGPERAKRSKRKAFVHVCKTRNFSKARIDCTLKADKITDLRKCKHL